jgi:hypothetical protein
MLFKSSTPRKIAMKFKIASGRLVTNDYSSVGVVVAFPHDVLDVDIWSQKWYKHDTGFQSVNFTLGKMAPPTLSWLDEVPIWVGVINTFDVGDDETRDCGTFGWTSDRREQLMYDTIQTKTKGAEQSTLGYERSLFCLRRKHSNGQAIHAYISYCEYSSDVATRHKNLSLISNILESIQFAPAQVK